MTASRTTMTGESGRAPSGATRNGIVAAWVALAVGLPALVIALSSLSTVDLAYGVRTGQLVLGGAGIPRVDTFTFTAAGLSWVDQQWLAHVIFGAAYGIGGWAALQVLWVGVVAATVGLTARAAFTAGAGLRTSVIVALAGFVVAAQGLGLRAQALGLLCLAALLVLVAGRRARPRLLWLAVPLLAAWANLHGSFVVGLALLTVTAVDDRRDRSARLRDLLVLGAAAGATLANPYGVDAWRYVVSIGMDPTISAFVTEWRHTDPFQLVGVVFYGSIAGAVVVLALAARGTRRLDVGSLLWNGILAALGAWALRAVAWWGIGAVPAVAVAASRLTAAAGRRADPDDSSRGARPRTEPPAAASVAGPATSSREAPTRRAPVWAAALLVAVVAAGLALVLPAERRLTDAPSGIADAVRSIAASHPGLRVFDAQRWGSWLEMQVPDASYFADSRIELIPASAWRDYVTVSEAQPGWETTLDRWQVEAIALSSGDQPSLVAAIDGSAAWRVVHRDADGLVAVRA